MSSVLFWLINSDNKGCGDSSRGLPKLGCPCAQIIIWDAYHIKGKILCVLMQFTSLQRIQLICCRLCLLTAIIAVRISSVAQLNACAFITLSTYLSEWDNVSPMLIDWFSVQACQGYSREESIQKAVGENNCSDMRIYNLYLLYSDEELPFQSEFRLPV